MHSYVKCPLCSRWRHARHFKRHLWVHDHDHPRELVDSVWRAFAAGRLSSTTLPPPTDRYRYDHPNGGRAYVDE